MKLILKFLFLIIILSACRQSTEPEDDFKLPDVPDSAEVTFNNKGWAEIKSFPNNVIYENIRLVEAANEKTAWVSDWDISIIYKTENGGESWKKIEPPIKTHSRTESQTPNPKFNGKQPHISKISFK